MVRNPFMNLIGMGISGIAINNILASDMTKAEKTKAISEIVGRLTGFVVGGALGSGFLSLLTAYAGSEVGAVVGGLVGEMLVGDFGPKELYTKILNSRDYFDQYFGKMKYSMPEQFGMSAFGGYGDKKSVVKQITEGTKVTATTDYFGENTRFIFTKGDLQSGQTQKSFGMYSHPLPEKINKMFPKTHIVNLPKGLPVDDDAINNVDNFGFKRFMNEISGGNKKSQTGITEISDNTSQMVELLKDIVKTNDLSTGNPDIYNSTVVTDNSSQATFIDKSMENPAISTMLRSAYYA